MSTKSKSVCLAVMVAASALGIASAAVAHDGDGKKTRWGWYGGDRHHDHSDDCTQSQRQLDRNTRTAIAYYTLAFNAGEPALAVEKYVGVDESGNKTYTQHNPLAADGPQAFIDFVSSFKAIFPDLNVDIVRTIAQCDLVMTHAHITINAEDLGNVAMDIFRFDKKGKIVEHWDSVQAVIENPANDNTQF